MKNLGHGMPEGGDYLARAEAKLAELGPGRAERLRIAIEEAFAVKTVLEHLADDEAAEDEERLVDALAAVMDRLHRRGARQDAGDGELR